MKHFLCLISLMTAALLGSCSLLQQQAAPSQKEKQAKVLPPMYLGEVHQVYPSQGFALLRIIGPMPKPGVTLITHPVDGTTARMGNLAISEDSTPRNGLVVADIRAGSVVSGDRVFLYRNISPGDDPEETPLPKPAPARAAEDAAPSTPPMRVNATRDDLAQPAPQPAPIPEPAAASAEQETPPATSPHLPSGPIVLPSTPDTPPAYLNDIPDDVNQWN